VVEGNNAEPVNLMEFILCAFEGDRRIICTLTRNEPGLQLTYETEPQPDLVWPQYEGLQRTDELWRSTCCELFLGDADGEGYTELNLCPSGRWNCYRFDRYREGMREADCAPLNIRSGPGWLEASWWTNTRESFYVGPATVLADRQGHIDYLALRHGDKPDFHDRCQHVLVQLDDL
jgi:hypothetical protein